MSAEDGPALAWRALTRADLDSYVDLLVRSRESLGGSRRPQVIRAVGLDTVEGRGGALVFVGVDPTGVRAVAVCFIGGGRRYWRGFPRRHPVEGAHLAWRRARKIVRARWTARSGAPVAPQPVPSGAAASSGLPPDLEADPRLHVAAARDHEPGPHLRDEAPDLAFASLVLVDDALRHTGQATRLHHELFAELRRRGVTRYDVSFLLDYEPSIRLYLSLGFSVYRYPHGFFGTIELA